MTAKQMIRKLEAVVKKHGNVKVCANWPELRDSLGGLKDDCTHYSVTDVVFDTIHQADDDGGTAINKDGTEKMIRCAVII